MKTKTNGMWVAALVLAAGAGLVHGQVAESVVDTTLDAGLIWNPSRGQIRWNNRTFDVTLDVFWTIPGNIPVDQPLAVVTTVRMTVRSRDGRPVGEAFPTPGLTLEHRNRFVRVDLTREVSQRPWVDSLEATYSSTVSTRWAMDTRMTARLTTINRNKRVTTKIKNVMARFSNILTVGNQPVGS